VLFEEQQNPTLIAAVRVAQQAADPTPSELAEFRKNIDKASGRIRGLQATVVEHEKNGLLLPEVSGNAIAAALKRLLDSPALLRGFAQRAAEPNDSKRRFASALLENPERVSGVPGTPGQQPR
jgi:hypothetical protein